MKSYLSHLNAKCYSTILSVPLHRETYIPLFHLISYKTDHQIQMSKKRKHKRFLHCHVLCLQDTCFDFLYFFPNNMKRYKRTTTRIGHLCSSTKNKQKNKQTNIQKYNLMKICCQTPTRGKNL